MHKLITYVLLIVSLIGYSYPIIASSDKSKSAYIQKINDPDAVYFTAENFGIKADGVMDVSNALQKALNEVKQQQNFGIVFIPEGTYKISKTIYIPNAVRLIGYGKNRPVIILGKNSPGYQKEVSSDKGRANYMFWFTSGLVEPGQIPRDAGAGTFYSALSNVDLK
ncbi:MAG: glycoside hydrolase family 55 protein, partial [Porphyromonadaceae bacterium]|nr:glycoside hydrolase family 55 protein [Porphyromonadaceae bacterium]